MSFSSCYMTIKKMVIGDQVSHYVTIKKFVVGIFMVLSIIPFIGVLSMTREQRHAELASNTQMFYYSTCQIIRMLLLATKIYCLERFYDPPGRHLSS